MMLVAGGPPVRRAVTIALPNWPAGSPPLRVALISDLHTAWPGDSPSRLTRTIDTIAAERPDLLIVAGDVLSNGSLAFGYKLDASIAPLARIHPRLGCFAVQGNHDWTMLNWLAAAYARVGCTLLANEAARAGPLALIGTTDSNFRRARVAETARQGFALGGVPVYLTHNPVEIYRMPLGIPLALAGHTHCGQVTPPLLGVIWHEDEGRRYECGIVREPNRKLVSVIGAGLGTSNLPIRLGAVPDWWMLTLEGMPRR